MPNPSQQCVLGLAMAFELCSLMMQLKPPLHPRSADDRAEEQVGLRYRTFPECQASKSPEQVRQNQMA